MFLENELQKRNIPDILTFINGEKVTSKDQWEQRRLEIVDLLSREEYGYSPQEPFNVSYEIISFNNSDYANKVESENIKIRVETSEGVFSFPIVQYIPKTDAKVPCILHIAFRHDSPDKYMPVEEIIDKGCALVMFCYDDITLDKNDEFQSGIATYYSRKLYSWGKISMWAWAASRVMDYLQNIPNFNLDKMAVIGHSRLGKTALWCGANDTRFKYVFANNSGCSGDAITRNKSGEHIKQITDNFSYWFCDNYKKYIDNEDNIPFDQHFLLAAIAPRFVCCGASLEDTWADPYSQFLSCFAASDAFKIASGNAAAFICDDKFPSPGDSFINGNIAFFLRSGSHFLSRYDWNIYIRFMLSKI